MANKTIAPLSYEQWLTEVHKLLVHPSAIELTLAPGALEAWHRYGGLPKQAANILNERKLAQVAAALAKGKAPQVCPTCKQELKP